MNKKLKIIKLKRKEMIWKIFCTERNFSKELKNNFEKVKKYFEKLKNFLCK
jgi:hypothetical protein